MSAGKGILKKMSIYFIGTLSTKMLSVLLVPIYAYFVSATDLGEYDYITAVSSILYPIVYFAIWEGVLRFCIKKDGIIERNKVLSSAVQFFIIITLCVSAFFIIFFFATGKETRILFIMFFTISSGFTSIWQFSARAFEETKWYVISSIVGAFTIIMMEIIFIMFAQLNYTTLCISNLISQVVIIILLEYRIRLFKFLWIEHIDARVIKKLLAFTIPLVINSVSLYLYNSGSKMIIKNYIGAYENGLFSFASKFSMLINLFSTVVSMAVIEEAYSFKTISEYKEKMSVFITKISKGYFSLIIVALPAIYLLYSIAFRNTEYYQSVNYVFILLLGALFTALSNNFGSSFQVTDNTKYISLTTIAGAAIAIAFSLFTVKIIGVLGVLIGGAIGPFMMMLLRAVYAKKATGLSISLRSFISLFAISIVEYVILVSFDNTFVYVAITVFDVVAIYFINKKDIDNIILNVRKGH